ncbi:MAG: hypothetical protein KH328_01290 [Staphylococcus sp.]|nr:hypothetical protein [Staphylococcus sp.]
MNNKRKILTNILITLNIFLIIIYCVMIIRFYFIFDFFKCDILFSLTGIMLITNLLITIGTYIINIIGLSKDFLRCQNYIWNNIKLIIHFILLVSSIIAFCILSKVLINIYLEPETIESGISNSGIIIKLLAIICAVAFPVVTDCVIKTIIEVISLFIMTDYNKILSIISLIVSMIIIIVTSITNRETYLKISTFYITFYYISSMIIFALSIISIRINSK